MRGKRVKALRKLLGVPNPGRKHGGVNKAEVDRNTRAGGFKVTYDGGKNNGIG